MDEEQGISRRTMLKRIGAGAAVAWSAPIIASFGSKAFAGLPGRCNAPCDVVVICALNRPGDVDGLCGCSANTEGKCHCWANCFCADLVACGSSSECPAGWTCVPNTGCGAQGFCMNKCGQSCVGGGRRPAGGRAAIRIN